MRFFLLGNADKPQVVEQAAKLREVLPTFGDVVLEDLLQQEDLSCRKADVALVLGGDGAILRAARQMGYCQTPALGVNMGRLGFLADVSPEELPGLLPEVVAGRFALSKHIMMECEVRGPDGGVVRQTLALNDVVVHTGPPFHMTDLELSVGEHVLLRMIGDGLILGTPVGSTAHSLSAGGPILNQELDVFVITPIAAHALTHRPLVESAHKEFTLRVLRSETAWLIIDGQETHELSEGHTVIVRKAPVTFDLIKVAGRTYYQTLREKLNWGELPKYRDRDGGK